MILGDSRRSLRERACFRGAKADSVNPAFPKSDVWMTLCALSLPAKLAKVNE